MKAETFALGIIFDHATRTVDELNRDVITLAVENGWEGTDSDDRAFILTLIGVEPRYSDQPSIGILNARRVLDDELALSENLTWLADDAETYLNDHCAPEGAWIGNDEGAFGVWCIACNDDPNGDYPQHADGCENATVTS